MDRISALGLLYAPCRPLEKRGPFRRASRVTDERADSALSSVHTFLARPQPTHTNAGCLEQAGRLGCRSALALNQRVLAATATAL